MADPSRKLRILTLTNWYPPHHIGGYEISCFDVMSHLEARGHRVEVLCSDQRLGGPVSEYPKGEARVRRELELYLEDGVTRRLSLRERLALERRNQASLARALSEVEPDVVSVWHMGAMSLGLLATVAEDGIPMVYGIYDNWLSYGLILDSWAGLFNGSAWRRAAGRVLRPIVGVPTTLPDLSRTGAFCFVSSLTRRRSEEGSPWPEFPVAAVVGGGIETALFPRLDSPPQRPWGWRLVYVGRLDPRKGTKTLVEAFAELPEDAGISFFGHPEAGHDEELRALATELGVEARVRFGTLQRSELAHAYGEADLLVFPSEWEEPFGLVPIEAMACGTPVVATGVGGSTEFLEDGENCLLYEAGNPGALAAAVRSVAGDPQLRLHLAENGLATARYYTAERLAREFERWHLTTAKPR